MMDSTPESPRFPLFATRLQAVFCSSSYGSKAVCKQFGANCERQCGSEILRKMAAAAGIALAFEAIRFVVKRGSIEDMHRAYGLSESTGNVYQVTCVLKPGEQRTFARGDIDCFLATILPHHRFVQLRIHQKYVLDAVMMRENAVRIVESVLRLNRENKASKRRFFYVEFSGCALYSWWPKECARFYTNGIFLTPFWKTSTKRDRKNITFYVDSFRCSASWLIGWNYQNSAQLYDDAIRKSVTPGYGSPKRFAHPPFPDNVKL
ncbi:unnamed protein product, partial [Mesorhabditis spiculigera]